MSKSSVVYELLSVLRGSARTRLGVNSPQSRFDGYYLTALEGVIRDVALGMDIKDALKLAIKICVDNTPRQ